MTRSLPPDQGNCPADRAGRHSRRFSDEIVEEARRVFQKRTDRKLTHEDGRQILENLVGFFSILHEWDRASAQSTKDDESTGEEVSGTGK